MEIVRDLMVPLEDYSHVSVGTSLRDAITALAQVMTGPSAVPFRPRDRGVLVQDRAGRVIGKLSLWDLLDGLKPHFEPPIDPFGTVDDRLLWSQWLRADLAPRIGAIRVEDLLRKPADDEIIDEDAPLDLAVHRLIRKRQLSLLVMRGEVITGVLRLSDVFKAVNELIRSTGVQTEPA
ncbi:MAG: hypothetical protein IPK66_12645 [Rhodospirillales bacterium]|nr:hypothetical protein [Rhodospirillales bacterium]